MNEIFEKYGIILTEDQEKKLDKFYNILIEYNNKFNLTAITEKQEVYIKHFVDSLLTKEVINGDKFIDVGSGGGFPAIPLKIVKENAEFTLLDATNKKCEYLKDASKMLGLEKVSVVFGRAEELGRDEKYREKFDVCTARAVASLDILAEYCLPFVKVGGVFVSYKGDAEEEIKKAVNAIKTLGGRVKDVLHFDLEGAKRTVVIIEKVKSTDGKYPRTNGKIRKNPL